MTTRPNPQGKGLVPVLESILVNRLQTDIPAKNIEQVICELFTSQFILQGEFKFCPVIERPYWLYRKNNNFRLSMIAPKEWSSDSFGQSIAECVMQADMTWTIKLSEEAKSDEQFIHSIESQWEVFNSQITTPSRLKQAFPVYDARLPFYQRVLASNLAYSLGVSLDKQLALMDDSKLKLLEPKNHMMSGLFGKQ